jgi:hypothetical protein
LILSSAAPAHAGPAKDMNAIMMGRIVRDIDFI